MLLSSLIDMNIHKFASVDDFMNVIKQAFCFLWEQWKREWNLGKALSIHLYQSINKKGKLGLRMYVCGHV